MNQGLPPVSVIIAARPGQNEIGALSAVRELDYPRELLEVIVARGNQPAAQRNAATAQAQGELLYFLDDDALPARGNLRQAAPLFTEQNAQVTGGPNLCPITASNLEQVFAAAMAHRLAFGPSCARYRQVGSCRRTSEKELILCNLIIRRTAFLDAGGFDEALYPNEENALLDSVAKRGGLLLYDPDLLVWRRPRATLKAFMVMLFRYGRGRAEQFRLHPTTGSLLNFVPPLFCLYLLICFWLPAWALWPLAGYALILLAGAWHPTVPRHLRGSGVAGAIFLTHLLYGIGFWRGLFTRLRKPTQPRNMEVTLERIPLS